ncbi:MAG: hypothetical protein ACRDQU_06420 [Pseudonocardiaceae bacterium]
MERSTVRKVIRAASLSLLLATATGVAGLEIVGASPAMAQQDTPGGSNPAPGFADPGDAQATPSSSAAPAAGGIVPDLGDPTKAIGNLGAP